MFVGLFFGDRKVKMHNLWEYTSMRKSLLSKRIYLLMSACEENCAASNKAASEARGDFSRPHTSPEDFTRATHTQTDLYEVPKSHT